MEGTSPASENSKDALLSVNSDIPSEFAEYSEKIKATSKQTITFKLNEADNLKPWQSKVGGQPYLPLTQEIPTNEIGTPLSFLAQLNFCEIPPMPDYPTKGIVEFYIDGTSGLMGANFDDLTEQIGFRVLYFDTVVTCDDMKHHKYPVGAGMENTNLDLPLMKDASYSITDFVLKNQYMSIGDYRFETIIPETVDYNVLDHYQDAFPAGGHRIGGYPFFTQTDPRSDLVGYELLFQLDSDTDILWGDMGVGGFFIHPDDLKNCDFSKVAYYWDCC